MPEALMILTRPFYPCDSGRKSVLRTHFECLVKLKFSVTILLLSGNVEDFEVELKARGFRCIQIVKSYPEPRLYRRVMETFKRVIKPSSLNELFFWNTRICEKLQRMGKFDVVYFDMIRSMQYSTFVEATKKVFDFDDLLSKRYSSAGSSQNLLGYRASEQKYLTLILVRLFSPVILAIESRLIKKSERRYLISGNSINFFVSQQEADLVKAEYQIDNVYCLPMSFDKPDRSWKGSDKNKFLFLGNMNYSPNVASLEYIVTKVMPKLDSELEVVVIGMVPDEIKRKYNNSVTILGYVKDATEYFINSKAMLAPILSGTGIKTKVVEAMSYGLPVIGFDKTFEGMDISTEIGLIAQDTNSLVSIVDAVCENNVDLKKISDNGIAYFNKVFESRSVFRKYARIIDLA